MKIVNNLSRRLWNIGFCDYTPEELIKNRSLRAIKWMRHPYKDRWFADPFLFKVTDNAITVFVEEYSYSTRKGIICELEIDRKSMKLCQRRELLSLNTHLSYPIWIRSEGRVYMYPENGEANLLTMYEYNEETHKLIKPKVILNDAVADSSIIKCGGGYYLVATKYPNTEKELYLYTSHCFDGPYVLVSNDPVQTDWSHSRPGGKWFSIDSQLYRPAQNCRGGYGRNLSIMSTTISESSMSETECFKIEPHSFKYNLGLHTINFLDGICVIDGHGYKYPVMGRVLDLMRKLHS